MNGNLEPRKSDKPLLPAVVAIIVLGLGALVWEWHSAHHTAARPEPVTTQQSDP